MIPTFIPEVRRWANFYFFAQNLAEWHSSNRPRHNKNWRTEVVFSPEAEAAIKSLKTTHEKYPFGDKYLGRPFFLYDDPWLEIGKIVSESEAIELEHIFVILEPYFDIIYRKDEPALQEWAKILARPAFAESATDINKKLAKFYSCKPYAEICTLYLLLSTAGKNGGTAGMIHSNAITIEISRISTNEKLLVRDILWHELIHLYFRNHVLYPILENHTGNNRTVMQKVDEWVASALLPNGLLTQTKMEAGSQSFNSRIGNEVIVRVQKLIQPYLENEATIDERLVSDLCALAT